MIRALIFDFDGLILDTETCVFEAWRNTYADHGQVLPRDRWLDAIGSDHASYDPLEELRALVGAELDVEEIHRRRRNFRDEQLHQLEQMPGVLASLEHARERRIGLAIASSSPMEWVGDHIERLGLSHFFEQIVTADQVRAAKPAPDLYLRAVELLGVHPSDAIALEDSPNGVAAAKAAGLYCVAVPGPMTRTLSFAAADAVLPSLDAQPAAEWIAEAATARAARGQSPGRPSTHAKCEPEPARSTVGSATARRR
jgi:HAD superfamily hydrolase (TIGR01509 family)